VCCATAHQFVSLDAASLVKHVSLHLRGFWSDGASERAAGEENADEEHDPAKGHDKPESIFSAQQANVCTGVSND